jgi:hypothetical protein
VRRASDPDQAARQEKPDSETTAFHENDPWSIKPLAA